MGPEEYDADVLFDGATEPSAMPLTGDMFLHGVWVDEASGATVYLDCRGFHPRAVYCEQGDDSLSGGYGDWRWNGHQYICRFSGQTESISGYLVLQKVTLHVLVGGWWDDRDVPEDQPARLPFLPGVHPVRWVRQANDRAWPAWALKALNLKEAPPAMTTTPLPPLVDKLLARTAEGRYHQRLAQWTGTRTGLARWTARLAHHGWWLVHNVIAHPLLALSRGRTAVRFHDWTSQRLSRESSPRPSQLPQVERPLWWWTHNVASHLAIGLLPCAATFRWHDATAERMRVRGWV